MTAPCCWENEGGSVLSEDDPRVDANLAFLLSDPIDTLDAVDGDGQVIDAPGAE